MKKADDPPAPLVRRPRLRHLLRSFAALSDIENSAQLLTCGLCNCVVSRKTFGSDTFCGETATTAGGPSAVIAANAFSVTSRSANARGSYDGARVLDADSDY